MKRQRWYRRVLDNSALCPQFIFSVRDLNGVGYLYGLLDNGYMMRLNNGATWDGANIIHRVKTAAIMPTGSIWDECLVRKIKMLHEIPDFTLSSDSITVYMQCYVDSVNTNPSHIFTPMVITQQAAIQETLVEYNLGGTFEFNNGYSWTVQSQGEGGVAESTQSCNMRGLSFTFEFWRESDSFSFLGDFGKRMLGWGFQFQKERERE
jgi:hypothetical protein